MGSNKWEARLIKGGALAITAIYDDGRGFSEGLAAVKMNGAWGYITQSGELAIPPRFNDFKAALPFFDGIGRVPVGDKCGYFDRTGQFVIEPRFDVAGAHRDDLACVSLGSEYGFIDKTAGFRIEPTFRFAYDFAANHGYPQALIIRRFSDCRAVVGCDAEVSA